MKHITTTNQKSTRNTQKIRERNPNMTLQKFINIQKKQENKKQRTTKTIRKQLIKWQ